MCGFWNYAEDCDEDGAARNEEGTKDHPWREDVAKNKTRKERIPKKRYCAKGSENNDWKGRDLDEGSEEVRG